MKRKYVFAGFLATLSILSSFALVFADIYPPTEESLGWVSHGKGCPFRNWFYIMPQEPPYSTEQIEEMHFWFVAGEVKIEIPITETGRSDYTVEFEFDSKYMKYGGNVDYTWLEIKMDNGQWYYAVGPAPMWRRGG